MGVERELATLRAEVAELRAVLDHLTSGQAELVVRRLAVMDDSAAERVTVTARSGGEAAVKVISGDAEAYMGADVANVLGDGSGRDHIASISMGVGDDAITLDAGPRGQHIGVWSTADGQVSYRDGMVLAPEGLSRKMGGA